MHFSPRSHWQRVVASVLTLTLGLAGRKCLSRIGSNLTHNTLISTTLTSHLPRSDHELTKSDTSDSSDDEGATKSFSPVKPIKKRPAAESYDDVADDVDGSGSEVSDSDVAPPDDDSDASEGEPSPVCAISSPSLLPS